MAYNLGNLWRRLVLPQRIDNWSLTSLQQRLVNRRPVGKTCAVLLAAAGGKPPDAAALRSDGAEHCCLTGGNGLDGGCWYSKSGKKEARDGGACMEVPKSWNLPVLMFYGRAKVALGGCEDSRRIKMQLTGSEGKRLVYTEPPGSPKWKFQFIPHRLSVGVAARRQRKQGSDPMPRAVMKVDVRLIPALKLDGARTVLVELGALSVLAKQLVDPTPPTLHPSELVSHPGGPTLANIIQSIVLYDTIAFDSVLLHGSSDAGVACELFKDVIHPVYIDFQVRNRIGDLVRELVSPDVGPPEGISQTDWDDWRRADSVEVIKAQELEEAGIYLVPPDYAKDSHLQGAVECGLCNSLPECCVHSMMTLGRTYFYMELAREIGAPYAASPHRAQWLKVLLQRFSDEERQVGDERGERIKVFHEKTTPQTQESRWSFAGRIPAVAEHALLYAKRKQCSLRDATLEIRQSKHATRFRKWCAEYATCRAEGTRPSLKELERMDADFNAVCEMWKGDEREGVDFKTRVINLEDLPWGIGKLLKAADMAKREVHDRVIWVNKEVRQFLFLNDLIRQPEP